MDVHRINVKLLLDGAWQADSGSCYRVFNMWIQDRVEEGLVDVADYSHLPDGPLSVLVGHEANISIDRTEGRLGLLVARKQPIPGNLQQRLEVVLRTALRACRRLETDPSLTDAVRFRAEETEWTFNDRLRAPDGEEAWAAVRPALESLLGRAYPGAPVTFRPLHGAGRLSLCATANGSWDTDALLRNLAG